MPENTPSEDAPKVVRGEELDTDEGSETPAQQNVGRENSEGGGEWPDPHAPAQAPAPGAIEEEDRQDRQAQATRSGQILGRALALVVRQVPVEQATDELRRLAGEDAGALDEACAVCEEETGRANRPELRQALEYLQAARTSA